MEAINLATLYDLPALDWAAVDARLTGGLSQAPGTGGPGRHTCWLATVNPDGTPHLTGIGAWWDGGGWWFSTGRDSRKGRNLARDPRCTLSVSATEFDLTVEGDAALVTDPPSIARYAKVAAADGWPARPDDSGTALTADYSAPSAGPPPWHVYRLTPRAATALGTVEPGGATRWRF